MPDEAIGFCSRCGASVQAGANFCPACGAPYRKSAIAPRLVGQKPSQSDRKRRPAIALWIILLCTIGIGWLVNYHPPESKTPPDSATKPSATTVTSSGTPTPKLAARYEKLADLYTERQIDELESGAKIPLNLCQSGGGIATDKAMALRGDPSLIIQQKVDLQNQSGELEAIQGLYDLIASIAARMKPLLDELSPPPELPEPSELKWYNRHRLVQDAQIYGLGFVCKMAGAGQSLKARGAKALPPGNPSRPEENAAQKEN
jgi:zinc-ribbon domain